MEINSSPIRQFYKEKTIFVTGGFGFVGKILIEKLLRCEVKRIYLLARPKKGKSMHERLEIFIQDPAFKLLREQSKGAFSKVFLINGDLQKLRLGICDEDYLTLLEQVEIIFHAAADVRFDENLKETIETNVRGTREIMFLSQAMTRLEVFIYISTCFVALDEDVKEKVLPTSYDADVMIKLAETLNPDQCEKFEIISSKIIGDYPNNYTFTKALAEQIVQKFSSKMKIAIVRPSIISTSFHEPLPGYTDNVYGVNGVAFGAGMGFIRIFYVDYDLNACIIPADYVTNTIIATAWFTCHENKNFELIDVEENCKIYHAAHSATNPVKWAEIHKIAKPIGEDLPFPNSVWIITWNASKYYFIVFFSRIFYHMIPAIVVDKILEFLGKKPKMLKIYRKVTHFSAVLNFFSLRTWNFQSKNMQKMLSKMTPEDRTEFYCDIETIDWPKFLKNFTHGVRTFLAKAKDDKEDIEKQRSIYRKRKIIHYIMMTFIYILIGYVLYRISKFYGIFDFVFDLFDQSRFNLMKIIDA